MVHSKVKNYNFILHLTATMLPALAFIFTVATCIFGTYLQSGVCVVSCNSGTIGDSSTRECRDVQGELVVLVISIALLIYCLLMTCVYCYIVSVHEQCLDNLYACFSLLNNSRNLAFGMLYEDNHHDQPRHCLFLMQFL